ncbi:hypothetical protein [Streptomyces sp. NPDC056682]|uniref:hypothetical protein n=1 Tax=Streptomyces sp. NPDC056682 TaxID=3345909 RepID=UPI003692FA9E
MRPLSCGQENLAAARAYFATAPDPGRTTPRHRARQTVADDNESLPNQKWALKNIR